MRVRLLFLVILSILLVGCAPLAAIAPSSANAGSAAELTLIYTGFGRGVVDPSPGCA